MEQVRGTYCKWNRPKSRRWYKQQRNRLIRRLARQNPEAPVPKYRGWAD